jgi:hypothetical protein
VVSVLATGLKGRRFKPGRSDGFLRATKIRSTHSFVWEVKPDAPYHKILRHVKYALTMSDTDTHNSHSFHSSYSLTYLCGRILRELW